MISRPPALGACDSDFIRIRDTPQRAVKALAMYAKPGFRSWQPFELLYQNRLRNVTTLHLHICGEDCPHNRLLGPLLGPLLHENRALNHLSILNHSGNYCQRLSKNMIRDILLIPPWLQAEH
jgi:hypothetical protein